MSSDTQLVIGPNASLTVRQAWWVMATLSAVALSIAGAFAALGYWPVLPFAGLELAAVGAALWVAMRRNREREVLVFSGSAVRLQVGRVGLGPQRTLELSRAGTRALIESGANPHQPTRLLLSSGGAQVEIGRCLTDAERARLAARIRELLQAGQSPDQNQMGDVK